jgi:hypothetical protein
VKLSFVLGGLEFGVAGIQRTSAVTAHVENHLGLSLRLAHSDKVAHHILEALYVGRFI